MRVLMLTGLILSFFVVGCAGPAVQVDDQLHATRAVLNDAKANKLDKKCPKAYKQAEDLQNRAVALYRRCKCANAMGPAQEAYKQAKSLCPPVPCPAACKKPAPPKDSDGDGVIDSEDRCPNTPRGAKVNKVGCWIIKGLLFDFNKADIKPQYYKNLDEAIKVLKENPGMKVEIQGHTDNIGSAGYNLELSKKRAQAVANYLIAHGIAASRLVVKGYGFSRPVAPNDTPEGRALNRRVQLKPIR